MCRLMGCDDVRAMRLIGELEREGLFVRAATRCASRDWSERRAHHDCCVESDDRALGAGPSFWVPTSATGGRAHAWTRTRISQTSASIAVTSESGRQPDATSRLTGR